MEKLGLTKAEARRYIIAYQGLNSNNRLVGKQGILDYIRRVGCIQFDPLNVVGYNQELVLQSRVPEFNSQMLNDLLYKERELIDCWDKCMSILPAEDWPYFQRNRQAALARLDQMPEVQAIIPLVKALFESQGPLSSKDLDYDQVVDWSWAPTRLSRAVLETMYFTGDLIIHHKERTRKVYDLSSRHFPSELLNRQDPNISLESYHDWQVMRRIGAIGLLWNKAGDAWLGIHGGLKSNERKGALERLMSEGKVIEVTVEDIHSKFYMRSSEKHYLNEQHDENFTAILAPLDNMLWDRKLIKELFDFDYRWEVYKPVVERSYGYYVLPVFHNDRFVARFEPAQDKKTKTLIVLKWWWEPNVIVTDELLQDLNGCFLRLTSFLGLNDFLLDSEVFD